MTNAVLNTPTPTASDLLWRVNNEYRKRLTQAQTLLALLEQFMAANTLDAAGAAGTLHALHQQLDLIAEEHRSWRYHFYYASAETKRMVQDERQINQALARFNRMRGDHERRLLALYEQLYETPRPDPASTRIPTGDLWTMTQFALYDLVGFTDYVNGINHAT